MRNPFMGGTLQSKHGTGWGVGLGAFYLTRIGNPNAPLPRPVSKNIRVFIR
jgi:hypothetical protein